MAKRAVASGYRQRPDGKYESRFTINGKRYSVYGATMRECKEKESDLREQIKAGLYTRNRNMTLDRYYEEWLDAKNSSIKESTYYSIQSRYMNSISPALGKRKLADLEKREIIKLQRSLSERMKPSSVNTMISLLKEILEEAVNDGIILKSPAAGVRTVKEEGKQATETIHRALTVDDQEAFITEARQEWFYELLALLLCTGMRVNEAAALKWSDIDYVNGVIHVRKTLSRDKNGKYAESTTKTKAGIRDIPLTEVSKNILKSQKEKMKLLRGNVVSISDRIFEGIRGGVVHDRCVIFAIESTLKRLEAQGIHIERFTTHALRDTFATRYIEQGGNPQTLKTILGHTSLSMTMDLYAHVLPNTKKEEMDKISAAFEVVTG